MNAPAAPALRPLVLLGAGGHARVLLALLRAANRLPLGVCDPGLHAQGISLWEGLAVLGDDAALNRYGPQQVDLVLGVGQLPRDPARAGLYGAFNARGFSFPPLVHPDAWVSPDAVLADGVQVMAGAIVQPGCSIGPNTIVNTRASVDHDCRLGANVHVAPGAVLCGAVTVGDHAFIGAGAVVTQGLRVGQQAIVGAGVTLVRDAPTGATLIGSATRLI